MLQYIIALFWETASPPHPHRASERSLIRTAADSLPRANRSLRERPVMNPRPRRRKAGGGRWLIETRCIDRPQSISGPAAFATPGTCAGEPLFARSSLRGSDALLIGELGRSLRAVSDCGRLWPRALWTPTSARTKPGWFGRYWAAWSFRRFLSGRGGIAIVEQAVWGNNLAGMG